MRTHDQFRIRLRVGGEGVTERIEAPPLERILGRSAPRPVTEAAYAADPTRPLGGPRRPGSIRKRLTRTLSSQPVRVPYADWSKVVVGEKRIFRAWATEGTNRRALAFPSGEEFPRPVLVYSQAGEGRGRGAPAPADVRVMVVTAYRQEPLGAISRRDLELEGFASIDAFRRYWRQRNAKVGWRPDELVNVIELRPWDHDDYLEMGHWALVQLFGEHL